jgi:hypothetical protein
VGNFAVLDQKTNVPLLEKAEEERMQLPNGITVKFIEDADIDELYDLLGRQLVIQDPIPSGERDRIRRAKIWLLAKRAAIRNAICKPDVRETLESKSFEAALALIDGMLAIYSGGIPVTLISAILMKTGIDEVCNDD